MHNLLPLTQEVPDISVVPEGTMDKLIYGLKISLIGMGTVFLVLVILMIVLYLFKLVFYTIPNKKKGIDVSTKPVKVQAPAVAPAPVSSQEDELLPVIIAAAVAAYMEKEAPQTKYRIRSFKRI